MNTSLPFEDIILPPAISWWPLALGWWLVIAAGLSLLALLGWFFYKKYQQRKKIQRACTALQERTHALTGAALYTEINAWLKLQIRPYQPEALNLYGQAWLGFLNSSTKEPYFSGLLGEALSQGIYQAQPIAANPTELTQAATLWLHDYLRTNSKGSHYVGN